jgi:hypothetical protein
MLFAACAAIAVITGIVRPGRAGVVNPDISVVGQPFMRWTDSADDPARKRATLDIGQTEFVFDAYLNPYARGTFVAALSEEEGIDLEEGYFQMFRGLPGNIALKGGKYRLGFGKLNPRHYGQRHITYSRPGNSMAIAELSPTFLHKTAPRDPSRAFSIGG